MNLNTLLVIMAAIGLFFIALLFSARGMRNACRYILDDLKRQKAITAEAAVDLPYCHRQLLRFGLRDYRPQALTFLVRRDFVRVSPEGRFYLNEAQGINQTGANCPLHG